MSRLSFSSLHTGPKTRLVTSGGELAPPAAVCVRAPPVQGGGGGLSPLCPALCAPGFPLRPGPSRLATSPGKQAEGLVLEPGKPQYQASSQGLTGRGKPCFCLERELGSSPWPHTHGLPTWGPWALAECLGLPGAAGQLHECVLFSRDGRRSGCGPARSPWKSQDQNPSAVLVVQECRCSS